MPVWLEAKGQRMLGPRRAEGGEEGGMAAWAASVQRTQRETPTSENQASLVKAMGGPSPSGKRSWLDVLPNGTGRALGIHEQSSVETTSLGSVVLPSSPSFFSSESPGHGASSGHLKTHIPEIRMDTALFLMEEEEGREPELLGTLLRFLILIRGPASSVLNPRPRRKV